jgi:pSer/pThr/pTyr-binding forkhead associated (FHA) protein
MPLLHDDAECCVLQTGTYTLGGNGADALPITRLECYPRVATIVVPTDGLPTIQRLTASVVVRLDQTPIGIAPKTLTDGVEIEFADCRLTFRSDEHGAIAITSSGAGSREAWSPVEASVNSDSAATAVLHARILNVQSGETIELGNGRLVVGRDDSCDLIVSGMRVSRRHCSIAPVQDGYLLRDESANGTIVNGKRMTGTYLLGHGDVVRVDEHELRFEIDGLATTASSSEAGPTAVLDLSYVRSIAARESPSEPASPATATLEIVKGRFAGASFAIDRPVCAIGRGPQCDVRIRDESVSTNHATLLRKGTSWFVVDLRSANGTFVDGSRIAGERQIASGTRLKLGGVELEFRCADAAAVPVERKWKGSWLRRAYKAVAKAAVRDL